VKYWLFRLATMLVPRIPVVLARPLFELAGLLAWALSGKARRRVERNLRHVPTLASHPRQLRQATRGVFRHTALNYLDFLCGAHISDEELRDRWVIEGLDLFHQTMAQGKGLVILTGHFGNWEFGVSRLGIEGYPIVAPAERMRPERLFELFCAAREHHGVHLLPADNRDTLRQLVDALKANQLAAFAADRYVVGSSMELPFFGEPARLPTAPVALALRSGAPVMAIFCWRDPGGWRHGRFVPLDLTAVGEAVTAAAAGASEGMAAGGSDAAAHMSATKAPAASERGADAPARARSSEAVARAMTIFVRTMEEMIMAHPEQWTAALARVWDDAPVERTEARQSA
jgi:KDO2-lipid IV(A) lauroyltransferase